jgi:hypothetical protein
MSETMSEKGIPEAWVGQRVRVGHAHSASTHTDGVLLGVGDRGIVVEGGELVRFYPWTSVGSIEKVYEEVARSIDEPACVRKRRVFYPAGGKGLWPTKTSTRSPPVDGSSTTSGSNPTSSSNRSQVARGKTPTT